MSVSRAFAVFFCSFVFAAAAFADDDDDDLEPARLVPLPLARPTPKYVDKDPPLLSGACGAPAPSMRQDCLPFGPGEQLGFDLTVVGVRAGRAAVRVENKSRVDGGDVYPVLARVRTDAFLAAFGGLDASMVSYLDPLTMKPVRMANRTVTRDLFDQSPATTREDAVFGAATLGPAGARGGKVTTKFDHFGNGKSINRKGSASTRAEVVDALSIIYWLRSREMNEGDRFCFEMFHRRRLWRIEGKVGGVAETASPFATRLARRIDLTLLRLRPGQEPQPIVVWVSADDDQLPLILKAPDRLEVRLTSFKRGRALVRALVADPAPLPAPPGPSPSPSPSSASPPAPPEKANPPPPAGR